MYVAPSQNQRRPKSRNAIPIPKRSLIATIILLLLAAGTVWFLSRQASAPAQAGTRTPSIPSGGTNTSGENIQPSFDTKKFSTDDPASIWVVVNKQRPLSPKNYAPNDLRAPHVPLRLNASAGEMQLRGAAATALEQIVGSGKAAGVNLMLASGYRSYNTQVAVYGNEVKSYGQTKADTESARPGHSEHQTGLAVDLEDAARTCEITDCFANTKEGKWLAANAYQYGFILRYTPNKVGVTGYRYEPWHIRYIGTDLSKEMHAKGVTTLEEFFGLPNAPNY